MWWRLISVIMVLIVYYHIQHIPTWHVIGFFMSFPSHSPVDLAPQFFCSSKVYSETSGDVTHSSSLVYDIYRFAKTNIIPFKRNNPIVNHIHHSKRCLWLICDWPLTFTTWVTHTHTRGYLTFCLALLTTNNQNRTENNSEMYFPTLVVCTVTLATYT